MAETVMHALRTAADQVRYPKRQGNWPISPRIKDPKLMERYTKYLAQTGEVDAVRQYGELSQELAAIGIALPSLESDV